MTTIPNRSQLITLIAVIGLLLYGAYLIRSASYSVNGVDGSGYANIARSFLQGTAVKPVKELDQFGLPDSFIHLFTPVAYIPILPSKTIVPMYPIGVPLHMVAAVLIFGWNYGPFWVNPILAVLCLILIYLLGRDLGLERGYSIAGALILIANPTFNFMALQPVSDIAAMFWALVTIWAARRSDRGAIWGLLTGAALGISFLVRPVNVLLLPTLILATGFRRKTLITIILGGIPFAIVYFTYNTLVFGSPLLTGYTLATAQNLVTLSGFTERFEFYFYWLTLTMSPLVLIGWISMGFLSSIEGRRRALLILWFGTFLLFFACYNVYDEWGCTRFLLPAYPALIIGALLTAQHLIASIFGSNTRWRRATALVLLAVSLGFAHHYLRKWEIFSFGAREAVYAESCRWVDLQAPARTMIAARDISGGLHFYTDRSIIRWDYLQPSQWETLSDRGLKQGYQFYALLLPHEVKEARERMPGDWIEMGKKDYISLWRIVPIDRTTSHASGLPAVQ